MRERERERERERKAERERERESRRKCKEGISFLELLIFFNGNILQE